MKEEDVKKYEELDNNLFNRCRDICRIMGPIINHYHYSDMADFKIFRNKNGVDEIQCRFMTKWDEDYYDTYFPLSFIWSDDSVIKEYVEKKLDEKRQNEKLKKEKLLEKQLEEERKLYEKLKEKFG